MFRRGPDVTYSDLSQDLRDTALDWRLDLLRTFEYPSDVTCVATLPGQLLAVGTKKGSIYLFGRPGVSTVLLVGEEIRFLHFAPRTFHLLCADEGCKLSVFDLATYDQPKLISNTLFPYSISCMTVSPFHNHIFVGQDRTHDVRTFDLECLRKSSYTIPNLWREYQKKLAASGIVTAAGDTSTVLLDVLIHPRNLALLFVVYSGGVALYNLADKAATRFYALELIPGAPGGTSYQNKDILTVRRPGVTSISIHPAGHFFALGHDDGCISFWAVEDEDQPITVRTIDAEDVNLIDTDQLDEAMNNPLPQPPEPREPIYKLSWSGYSNSSDPRGGETTLAVFGGLASVDHGISTFLLPCFNPNDPTLPHTGSGIGSYWREAIRASLTPQKEYFYSLATVPQDFFLAPKDSLQFSGTFNPQAILFLLESPDGARVVKAFEYPPPLFDSSDAPHAEVNSGHSVEDDLAATLHDLALTSDARAIGLPSGLLQASCGLVDGQVLTMDVDVYDAVHATAAQYAQPTFLLQGGLACSDEAQANNLKFTKYDPRRMLVTKHRDLSIQFHDISSTLLAGIQPHSLQHDFPQPLPGLTIHVDSLLQDPALSKKVPTVNEIEAVHVALEAQETAVVLHSGDIVLYRVPSSIGMPDNDPVEEELILLRGVHSPNLAFQPVFALNAKRGSVTACAISDVGFLAAGYADGTLIIVDMRGPKIIYKTENPAQEKRRSVLLHTRTSDKVASLTWTISGLSNDPVLGLRLLAVYESSQASLFHIAKRSGNIWTSTVVPSKLESTAHPLSCGSFIFEVKTGRPVNASRSLFARVVNGASPSSSTSVWLSVGQKGAKVTLDINGERIARADWGSKHGHVVASQVVERQGSHSLVLVTDTNEVLAYSLPHLEFISKWTSPLTGRPSIDAFGDLVCWVPDPSKAIVTRAEYGTLFNLRRSYNLPHIDLSVSKPGLLTAPAPVSMGPTSYVGSWISVFTVKSITGEEVDLILGGPNRPIIITQEPTKPLKADRGLSSSAVADNAQDAQGSLYERLNSAMGERGQMLNDLEEQFNTLQQGTSAMVSQAKRLAAEQAAKSRFGF
ncbi:lethal giant larvae like, C-terminal-domain-containing protein [Flagelloscypha sp. PMI_526]|nr:lethal giant larvae like, C-terminal-domain-containing protein [Flagelloscypha sp. PMI_526]